MFKKSDKKAMIATLAASGLGLIASIVLSYEALILAANKDAVLSCDINAVVSCAAVANHWSATLLGIPNSFIGMIAMPVVMTIAVVLLTGVKLPKWFMQITQLGAIAGLIFAGWMFYMSYSVIGILCPWCLITDVAMIALFFGVTRYNILSGVLPIKKSAQKKLEAFVKKDYDQLAMWSLLVLIIIAIVVSVASAGFSAFVYFNTPLQIHNYVQSHKDELKGADGRDGQDGVNGRNGTNSYSPTRCSSYDYGYGYSTTNCY